MAEFSCCFCNSKNLSLLYRDQFHKVKKDHGPFNFYTCNRCHSGLTLPLPSMEEQQTLYNSFEGGMDESTRKNRDSNPLRTWYHQCLKRGVKYLDRKITAETRFNWIDIGAGKGELSGMIAARYPNSKGMAIDFHSRPQLLDNALNAGWLQCDLNDPTFSQSINQKNNDLIFSITVLEHVRDPDSFIKNIFSLISKNGIFYLTVPDYSSAASKLLGKTWPYYLPGEHLNIPSKKGLYMLLNRYLQESALSKDFEVFVKRTILPYPLSYYCRYFGLNFLARIFGRNSVAIKIPTGILEGGIKPVRKA